MIKKLIILMLLLTCTAFGVLPSRTPSGTFISNTTNTGSLTAVNTGDFVIAFWYNGTSTTVPTKPTGWWTLGSRTGTTSATLFACHQATSTSDLSIPAATNATAVVAAAYGGTPVVNGVACAQGAGNSASSTAAATTTSSYPAVTRDKANNWFIGFMASSVGTGCTPTGMTILVSATGSAPGLTLSDTNGGAAGNWATTTCAITSSNRINVVVELVATCQSTGWCLDDLTNMDNIGATQGDILTVTNIQAGSHGAEAAGIDMSDTPLPPTLYVGPHQSYCGLPQPVAITSGGSFAAQSYSKSTVWNGRAQPRYWRTNTPTGIHRWVTVIACFVPSVGDQGASWQTFDVVFPESLAGQFCVAQYISGDAGTGVGGPHFDLETTDATVANVNAITTAFHPYWVELGCDWAGGAGYLAVFDAVTGAQLGTTVTRPLAVDANGYADTRIGNQEIGLNFAIAFENVGLSYIFHDWYTNFTPPASTRNIGFKGRVGVKGKLGAD